MKLDEIKLYSYQEKALTKWRRCGYSGAIYFEPGLGKTFIALYALYHMFKQKKIATAKVIIPSSITDMWEEWLWSFGFTDDKLMVIRAGVDQKKIDTVLSSDTRPLITIISYGLNCNRDLPDYDLVILDESHYIKNPKSSSYKAVKEQIKLDTKTLLEGLKTSTHSLI